MSQNPDCSIVIVHYKTLDYTASCINSILVSPPQASIEIIVVDNASLDGSAEILGTRYPGVRLIRSAENRGVASGNNLGIHAGSGRYVLLLNSDTLVLPGSLDRVVSFLDSHADVGGVGGNLLNPDGSFQACFNKYPSLWQEFLHATRLGGLVNPYFPSSGPATSPREVDWIGTAFMLFRRDALDSVGPIDEEYFMYGDEMDLQYRLKRAGWKIFYLPDVNTVHFGGKSGDAWRRRKLIYRGHLLFFLKHRGLLQTAAVRLLFATTSAIKLLAWCSVSLLPGRGDRAKAELSSNLAILRVCADPK